MAHHRTAAPRLITAAVVAALLLALAPGARAAVSPDERLADPALEARARTISKDLRCLVCQNQSIDDSDAELARDLRSLVRERLVAGETDAQIKDYLVSRYGEFVLLKPPFEGTTLALWLGPPALLAAGAGAIALYYRRRRRVPDGDTEAAPLTPAERARLEGLMGTGKR